MSNSMRSSLNKAPINWFGCRWPPSTHLRKTYLPAHSRANPHSAQAAHPPLWHAAHPPPPLLGNGCPAAWPYAWPVPARDQRGFLWFHVRDRRQLVHKDGQFFLETTNADVTFPPQIACALYPTATNKNLAGGLVGIDTSSTFKSTSINFEFGKPFFETTGDGTEVQTTATLNGNTLTKDQVEGHLIYM